MIFVSTTPLSSEIFPDPTCGLAARQLEDLGVWGRGNRRRPLPHPLYVLSSVVSVVTLSQLLNEEAGAEIGPKSYAVRKQDSPQPEGLCPLLAPPPFFPKIPLLTPGALNLLKRPQGRGGGEPWVPFRGR